LTDGFGGNDLVIFGLLFTLFTRRLQSQAEKEVYTHISVEMTYILPADVEASSNAIEYNNTWNSKTQG
jgi:hypothetical protein